MNWYFKIAIIFCLPLLTGCGGTVLPTDPIKEMKKEFISKHAYTITLIDMDLVDGQYLHKYRVFDIDKNGKVQVKDTEWLKVDDDFFLLHADDFGMELFSKNKDGKYNNLITPPGFTHFIGNDFYGEWNGPESNIEYVTDTVINYVDSLMLIDDSLVYVEFTKEPVVIEMLIDVDSSTIWNFSTKYASLNDQLGLTGLDVSLQEYKLFTQKFLYNRPYYGPKTSNDYTKYGTKSSHCVAYYPLFYTRLNLTHNFYKPHYQTSYGTNRGGGGFGK